MERPFTGKEIRKSFIDFFTEQQHSFVPSSSLVPGGDQTLLFTNAGMVQFKDVFLGTDERPYKRAVNSQKCMRVAGKHNDLDDVGRDDTHHTFFEMLGNWSFGDYYKKEAITWAWQLLTDVWGLDKGRLWATCFKDDKGDIPTDDEAAGYWRLQPGINPEHILYFGRKENFWEMAETGPCGPCSEIHYDLGIEFCDKKDVSGHICSVNGDCKRYTELWNLVFIQYNRLTPEKLEPLPATHVDTGMGLDRVVSVLQGVYSNYRTDLLFPLVQKIQQISGQSDSQREENFTPYRVIADHSRAAAFLIADGVVPGNTGRNYVCRMIIRRAARFGTKIGLNKPFLAKIAGCVIDIYGEFYPELERNRKTILDNLTREEIRFQRTVEGGLSVLDDLLHELSETGGKVLSGAKAFDLYATHGLPVEITRDIAREQGIDVDEDGFHVAMESHRLASGAGKAFGNLGGEDVDIYRNLVMGLIQDKKLPPTGVIYDPYEALEADGTLLGILSNGEVVESAEPGDSVEVIIPRSGFYIEAGGQISDTGKIVSLNQPEWEIYVDEARHPATGVISLSGHVVKGNPRQGDLARAIVNLERRRDIMRNHTATHLLHGALHKILGDHARQAGSLVAPDRLRFDFTHPEGLTQEQLEEVEKEVNRLILQNHPLSTRVKPLQQAIAEGATALFGEKYGEEVRTVSIGEGEAVSYELCGGTHVEETGDIGMFLITSESSAAAGIRRIEAVTGRGAYQLVQHRNRLLKTTTTILECSMDETPQKAGILRDELDKFKKQVATLRGELALVSFASNLENVPVVDGIRLLTGILPDADADTLRQMTDKFREKFTSGIVVLGSEIGGKPIIIAAVSDDLTKRGINAGNLVKEIAQIIGGSGGGRPTLAQAGGKDSSRLRDALEQVQFYVNNNLK